jgi:hypothetical protein
MAYPRQLVLDEEVETKLLAWAETEILNHLGERTELVDRFKGYQSDYIAEPSTEVATVPFLGASNIIIPLTAIALEAVHSRMMQTAFALDRRVSAKILNPELVDLEPELELFLDKELIEAPKFRKAVEPAILELEKLGTGVIETTYIEDIRYGVRINDDGDEEEFEVTVQKGTKYESVPVTNFLQPFDDLDTQTARWCGKVFWLNQYEIHAKEKSGYFKPGTTEDLEAYYLANARSANIADDYKRETERLTDTQPAWPKLVEFYWIATCFEIAEEKYEEIFFIYHRQSRKIVSIWYNWFSDLRRPFRHGVYFPLEFRWYGIGIAKQNEQFQAEVTAQHRQRLDNSSIANMRMWKINRNANISPKESIYPGKLWFVDNPEDIMPMEMGDVKASAYNNENQVVIYSQQRTGVNELTLGMPNVGTPGTATSDMSRVQESARKFDYTYGNVNVLLTEVINDGLCNMVQWGPDIRRLKYSPKASEIEQFLKSPYELFRDKILMEMKLAGQNQNQFRDRQDAMQLVSVFQQYYTSMNSLIQELKDPAAAQMVVSKTLDGANLALTHILSTFSVRNPERYLIQLPPANPNAGQTPPAPTEGTQSAGPNSSVQFNTITAPNANSILPASPNSSTILG